MKKLTRKDLYNLEYYSEFRPEFRAKVMEHKKFRRIQVGPHATFYFEDRLTIHYQVQEMLRVERIFESDGINDELAAYNPLIPDGSNWKATFMIEYTDVEERKKALKKMIGIETRVWVRVDGFERVWAIADEDINRQTEEKTSSVHFLRFELSTEMAAAVKNGAAMGVGVDHDVYRHQLYPIPDSARISLAGDLG
jgi:hypothetical protein